MSIVVVAGMAGTRFLFAFCADICAAFLTRAHFSVQGNGARFNPLAALRTGTVEA